jgi:hypothetical protein
VIEAAIMAATAADANALRDGIVFHSLAAGRRRPPDGRFWFRSSGFQSSRVAEPLFAELLFTELLFT